MQKAVKYSREQCTGIQTIIRLPAAGFNPETYHELRVSTKKIQAFLQLAESCFGKPASGKYFKILKTIFKQAGKVRELQLELDQLEKATGTARLSHFKSFLKRKLKSEQHTFFTLKSSLGDELLHEPGKLKRRLRKLTKKQVKQYVNKECRQLIKTGKSKTLKTKQLHELRKGIKTVHYIRQGAELSDKKNPLLQVADNLSEELGKWHDARVLSQQLKSARESILSRPTEKTVLEQIRIRSDRRSKTELHKIEGMIKSL